MLPSFASDTITAVRPAWTTDSRNRRVADYDGPGAVRSTVTGCSVQAGASVEVLAGRQQVAVRWTVYAPPGTDIEATDAVEVEGRRYAVDGEPQRVKSPTGALSHVLLLLIDWK